MSDFNLSISYVCFTTFWLLTLYNLVIFISTRKMLYKV